MTIKENIAFGEDSNELNLHSVKEACKFAQIDEFIENRNNKYEEIVGENGIKLSGGQRQRIGLARAIYRNLLFSFWMRLPVRWIIKLKKQ